MDKGKLASLKPGTEEHTFLFGSYSQLSPFFPTMLNRQLTAPSIAALSLDARPLNTEKARKKPSPREVISI
jgi:hypothetical protein